MMRVALRVATRERMASALRSGFAGALLFLGMPLLSATAVRAQEPEPCTDGELKPKSELNISLVGAGPGESQPDLKISGTCIVKTVGDYYYGKVNVIKGGALIFKEGTDSTAADRVTNFWARSIIVEEGGALKAGVDGDAPYGTKLHTLNIILYGKDKSDGDPVGKPGAGDTCVSTGAADCGIPTEMWSNGTKFPGCGDEPVTPNSKCIPGLAKTASDWFYKYGTVDYDDTDKNAHYGYKVLAVGYGGTLQLRGLKGTTRGVAVDAGTATFDTGSDPLATHQKTDSGTSWVRLAANIKGPQSSDGSGDRTLTLDRPVEHDWQPGDKIVVTTTDYLPSHSEELTIATVSGKTVTVVDGVKWDHRGEIFSLSRLPKSGKFAEAFSGKTPPASAETRAAVALLTRSIRIVSGGDVAGDYFDCPNGNVPKELSHDKSKDISVPTFDDGPNKGKPQCATARRTDYSFGANTSFRQGFKKLQLQGVEFHQMGQGGRISHYPVHFHMARQVPSDTYIKDSSVNESMTRWYVLHSTLGVLLQRNVGWKSIGHGYYLEDGTEIDNKFYANIGIYARGAVEGPQNPRKIPGIIAENGSDKPFQYRSDVVYPAVFWITNGWNEFVGNMAAGAGTCGICFWFLSAGNHDMIETDPMNHTTHAMNHMQWTGYAGRQSKSHEGDTPVKLFSKNYCSTAMHSLNTTSDGISDCTAVRPFGDSGQTWKMTPIKSFAPGPLTNDMSKEVRAKVQDQMTMYYPNLSGNRHPSVCNDGTTNCDVADLAAAKQCDNADPKSCGTTVIDQYTSSFHWAETNFSAVWLRSPGWFLVDNSFISDTQNGGLTFVTGGDYSRSSSALGYWSLVSRSVFVGETNPDNKYARAAGPPGSMEVGGKLPDGMVCSRQYGGACISKNDSVGYPLSNWATGMRLFNIYDGPAYQDANAYLDIPVTDCDSNTDGKCLYFGTPGVRKYLAAPKKGVGYLPNAAIGWKQPNGFYYPPAFHSANLFFDKVDIRHYVILPILKPGTYVTDDNRLTELFKGGVEGSRNMMRNFTDIDRQTELNDDDGSLTGFQNTISVNEDGFFGAPTQALQCKSNAGVNPDKACATSVKGSQTQATARTSPYDYVTTVIYPGCAMNDGDRGDKSVGYKPFTGKGSDAACGSTPEGGNTAGDDGRLIKMEFRGGSWSKECAGPYCFGVPIYRQYLTSDNKSSREWQNWVALGCDKDATSSKCDFPFARMAGTSTWQRSVMTVNNGKFYIDTTRSRAKQQTDAALGSPGSHEEPYVECPNQPAGFPCEPRSVNEFEAGNTYFVFFVFAKKSTHQTYQIYVGPNFKPATGFKGIKIPGTEVRYKWTEWADHPWHTEMISSKTGKPDPNGDVLQVTVDFSKVNKVDFDPNPKTATNNVTCQPKSFCTWTGAGSCGCSLADNDPRVLINPKLKDNCKKVCEQWAVKDLDCPDGGCLGFSFTLPKSQTAFADDKNHRPPPEPFPMKDNDVWKTLKLTTVGAVVAGDCAYSATQTPDVSGSCGVPECALGETNPPLCTAMPSR
jgi:cell migration-inducing and hyaluronan-binding protein